MNNFSKDYNKLLCISSTRHQHFYLLFYHLHLLLDRHSSDAEGSTQLRSALLLQQLAVVLDNAVRLPRQLSLQ